jgi:hypothetical protein
VTNQVLIRLLFTLLVCLTLMTVGFLWLVERAG